MRDGWVFAVVFVCLWLAVMVGAYLWLLRLDRAAVRRSERLGPGFGLSGGQVRRRAARGRRERQGGM